jgi:glutathione synthase/RimK-type ligase-like ATP-grasp enzyme
MIIYPEVLFVTSKDDFATDYLIYQFKDQGVPYFRLNSEDITELGLSFQPGQITVTVNHVMYNLANVKSVYFRRAPTVFPNALHPSDTPFINRERKDFFEGLYLSLDAKWINPIFPTYMAERKLFQLQVANKIGFKAPNTIVSNDPLEVRRFIETHKQCIMKPISHGLQVTEEGTFSIYTSEITDLQWLETDKLFESPVLIQNKIENHRDIRVTVVGPKIFAVEITKHDPSFVDWRQPNIVKTYDYHNLPEQIKDKILLLHESLHLTYSALDFILTPVGEYIFLETNPAGEWVWLEKELDLQISNAIIDELLT